MYACVCMYLCVYMYVGILYICMCVLCVCMYYISMYVCLYSTVELCSTVIERTNYTVPSPTTVAISQPYGKSDGKLLQDETQASSHVSYC
jgi:hypothetical protein